MQYNLKLNYLLYQTGNLEMEDQELVFSVFNEIGIIAQLSNNAFDRAMPDGLSRSQFSVLNWFVRVDTVATPGRLSTAFMVTKGAMTNTLKKLEEKGLIEVRPDEHSGRQKVVTMTERGRQVREAALVNAAPLMWEVADKFPASQLRQHLPLLQALRKYLDEKRYS